MEGGCPLELQKYDFNVPSFVPNGSALFAWPWFNLIGNREMYMNSADVTITGRSADTSTFSALPSLFVANIANRCLTVEDERTVFAHPGNQVIYGGPVTSSSPVFPNSGD